MGLLDGFFGLAKDINKVTEDVSDQNSEGMIEELMPELKLPISDEDLSKMTQKWLGASKKYEATIKPRQDSNENYWLGKHFKNIILQSDNALVDNRIFVSMETLIPIVTSQNPEPLVASDNSTEGIELAEKVAKHLVYQTDIQNLKLKIQRTIRNWMLMLVGVVKISWDEDKNDFTTIVINSKKIILEPDATITEEGYTGEYIGEYKEESAADMLETLEQMRGKKNLPKKITSKIKKKLGTKIKFIEWWTNDMMVWTFDEDILLKIRNPHWNYGKEETVDDRTEDGEIIFDEETGLAKQKLIKTEGENHFRIRKMPYEFFGGVFSTGTNPHDNTSLIEQARQQQDLINKRQRQIDKNADMTNSGMILDSNIFSKEQADAAVCALRRGGAILAPGGTGAVDRTTGQPLPGFIFQTLGDYRTEIDNIFGTHPTTRGERGASETASGRIILKESDRSRASSITAFVERFVDSIYNWWVQMMYVYYDEEHIAIVIGDEKKNEFVQLVNDELLGDLLISVKEGSMIPKDPLTKRNEAVQLWKDGAIDPISLFEALDHPNPRDAAKKLFQWTVNPASLFPDVAPATPEVPVAGGAAEVVPPPVAVAPVVQPNPVV